MLLSGHTTSLGNPGIMEKVLNIETVLITRRTVVRRFREMEGAALFELIRTNATLLQDLHPIVLPLFENVEAAEVFVRHKLAEWLLQESYHFAIWDKDSATMIGYIAFDPIHWEQPKARLRGFIGAAQQVTGLMSEVLEVLLPLGFLQLGLTKVSLEVGSENVAAHRLARRMGFVREGDLREEYRKASGEPFDVVLFGLTSNLSPLHPGKNASSRYSK